ncbi:MAG: patatin-like phospholipase family protein [Deltaproteobacteria bacterium]|nr:patatin-like phospholipase family protein [Deltaproteobacteria bacterium]
MLHYLTYVGSSHQIELAKKSFEKFHAQPLSSDNERFKLSHSYLGDLELVVSLLSDIGKVGPHLKTNQIDLLIYDEREGGLDAYAAIHKIESDVASLAQQWGPDFVLPKGRIIVLLENAVGVAEKSFKLGRLNVKDVLVAPQSIAKTLRWIARVLLKDREKHAYKVGVACNGGAVEGHLYQAGCIHALNRALRHRTLYDCDIYSGVSSGSLHATALASGIPEEEIIHSIKGTSQRIPPLKSSVIYDFAGREIFRRFAQQAKDWGTLSPLSWLSKAIKIIPTGIFKGDGLLSYITATLNEWGGQNDFRSLHKELYIGATHQDTFEHVIMGAPPWTHVPISDAIRASCAIPPFFAPHKIDGTTYLDGQISSPCDLELLVRRGCNLIVIVDPILPYAVEEAENAGGLFNLIQSIKSLINTRFRSELAHSTERFPDVDFMVFQPYGACSSLMRGSPLKYKINTQIVDLAYKTTLARLRDRHEVYHARLLKYGFELADEETLQELEEAAPVN